MIDEYLTEKEVAKVRRCSLSKLRSDRWKGQGLPYYKIGRAVLYSRSDVVNEMEKNKINPSGNGDGR